MRLTAALFSDLGNASQTLFISKPHDFSYLVPNRIVTDLGKTGFEPS